MDIQSQTTERKKSPSCIEPGCGAPRAGQSPRCEAHRAERHKLMRKLDRERKRKRPGTNPDYAGGHAPGLRNYEPRQAKGTARGELILDFNEEGRPVIKRSNEGRGVWPTGWEKILLQRVAKLESDLAKEKETRELIAFVIFPHWTEAREEILADNEKLIATVRRLVMLQEGRAEP